MKRVTSADGTSIAYEAAGDGPPLVLVGGAFCDRTARASGTPLAALLAHRFTVFSYDRRGRGDSTDTTPWSIARELEDLAALLAVAGPEATLFGNSSGGLLAFDAAVSGLPISKLLAYEPPVILDPERARSLEAIAQELDAADAKQRVHIYFTQVMQMPAAPAFPGLETLAHTLAYDVRITARGPARLAERVRVPVVLMSGGASPPWLRGSIEALAKAMPAGAYRVLDGQAHAVEPQALADAISDTERR